MADDCTDARRARGGRLLRHWHYPGAPRAVGALVRARGGDDRVRRQAGRRGELGLIHSGRARWPRQRGVRPAAVDGGRRGGAAGAIALRRARRHRRWPVRRDRPRDAVRYRAVRPADGRRRRHLVGRRSADWRDLAADAPRPAVECARAGAMGMAAGRGACRSVALGAQQLRRAVSWPAVARAAGSRRLRATGRDSDWSGRSWHRAAGRRRQHRGDPPRERAAAAAAAQPAAPHHAGRDFQPVGDGGHGICVRRPRARPRAAAVVERSAPRTDSTRPDRPGSAALPSRR